jgi:5-methylcytosine-specific restriction endonuclease McrA
VDKRGAPGILGVEAQVMHAGEPSATVVTLPSRGAGTPPVPPRGGGHITARKRRSGGAGKQASGGTAGKAGSGAANGRSARGASGGATTTETSLDVGAASAPSSHVLVLNATYEPIHVCGVKRAAVLLLKEKAEVIETGEGELHAETTALPRPAIIRLRTYAPVPRRSRRRLTRRAVFARDDFTCQYCGARHDLTVDHVIPRSKGGSSEWENIVACCSSCNRRKADRMPHQARMFPKNTPRAPHPSVFIQVACPRIPPSWDAWLGWAA